jgi:pyrroline-5-carboxylate reductase
MTTSINIGFLGAGKMATALAKGFCHAGLVQPENLLASDVAPGARDQFAKETGSRATASNLEVVKASTVVFLAVKPAQVIELLHEVRDALSEGHLVISIAAGLPIARMADALPPHTRLIRVMPNTPALVGCSATAFALGAFATSADAELAQRLFGAVGLACQVNEPLLDAVTGLSGSGPAYIYMIIEALSDGGVAAGLPRDVATRLAAQTVLGSAQMVLRTGLHPGALKDQVTSPGGTTIEGIHQLEKAGVRAAMMNAVRAAADKSKLLGKG